VSEKVVGDKKMENNNEKMENVNSRLSSKTLMILAAVGFMVAGIVAVIYLVLSQNRIYVEKSSVAASQIDLSSQNGGILQKIYVSEGDTISANEIVAEVGQELIKSKVSGTVISAPSQIGETFMPGAPVVSIIQPEDLCIVSQIEEDKGLNEIAVGQRAFFTVDAFGAKKYEGIVDEVAPASRAQDIVFNISSQRQEQAFNIKIRFDVSQYPELKNGMSAKVWIYKN
jgi:multidrug resistance efflux pump